MPAVEFAGLISSIRGAIDVVKELKYAYDEQTSLRTQAELLERLIGIQHEALSVQNRHSELIKEKDELQKKLIEFDKWEEVTESYRLLEVQTGKFVYSLKNPQLSSEPIHWLCTNCFDDRKKSILQAVFRNDFDALYACPRCKANLYLHYKDYPPQGKKKFRLFGSGGA